MFGNLGSAEILIVGFVVLSLVGSKKAKELARGLGESQKEFRKVKREFEGALDETVEDEAVEEKGEED